MQDFYDNFDPNSNEIKDIYAHEIDPELAEQFPVDTDIEKRLHKWYERNMTKKDVIKELMKLVDAALDEDDKEEFLKLCLMYRDIQREFKYY